jgi:hypothetical protein
VGAMQFVWSLFEDRCMPAPPPQCQVVHTSGPNCVLGAISGAMFYHWIKLSPTSPPAFPGCDQRQVHALRWTLHRKKRLG